MAIIIGVFLLILATAAIIIFPVTRGIKQLYDSIAENPNHAFAASLLLAIGMGFSGILFNSLFWIMIFVLRSVLPREITQSITYAAIMVAINGAILLVPAIIIRKWWNDFRLTIRQQLDKNDKI